MRSPSGIRLILEVTAIPGLERIMPFDVTANRNGPPRNNQPDDVVECVVLPGRRNRKTGDRFCTDHIPTHDGLN